MNDKAFRALLARRVLGAGETVVWTGRPRSAEPLRSAGLDSVSGLALGALTLCAIARSEPETRSVTLGLALLALGLWVLSTPRPHRWLARRLHYAISDRRVLVVVDLLGPRVRTIDSDRLGDVRRIDHDDGTTSFDLARLLGPAGQRAEPGLTDGLWGVGDGDRAAAALAALKETRRSGR